MRFLVKVFNKLLWNDFGKCEHRNLQTFLKIANGIDLLESDNRAFGAQTN